MINKKYSELNDQLQNMNTYIFSTPEKQTELGLDAAQLKQFDTYKTQYQQSFAIYIDPAKKTPRCH
ncbi:MAG: hypothetical protein PSN36_07395 [Gammaproteobacteria bacterium]|nr:hypothetical protein [Gammaproteobacteria bacterium]